MKIETIRRRVKGIRAQMKERGLDALVLTKGVDVTYVTAFTGHDSWAVISRNTVYLITDSRYTEQAGKECLATNIVERKGDIAQAAGELLSRLKTVRSVGVEHSISLAAFTALKKHARARFKPTDSRVLAEARSIKDAGEAAAIRTAAAMSAKALEKTMPHLTPGITESDLAGLLDLEIRLLGCVNAFETIVAFGPNASRPHHQPGRRKLGRNDAILIDFGAAYKGYASDITRCFVVGKPTALYRKAYAVVERAQAAAIAAAGAGVKLATVDAAARDVIRDSGFPVYGHGSGHGLGLEIHEIPFLKEDAKGTLKAGQIITIEPGIYIPGKLGVRIEDDIQITEKGCRIVTTKCPHLPLPA